MKILAIDSSGLVASVAIVEEEILIAEYTICHKLTHSQTLLPMLDDVQQRIGLDLQEIDAIAVSCGPGSFTGLRIGSATAKGLGLALKKPIISVPTVDGLAYNLYSTDKLICPLMDARRNQVYTGFYKFKGEKMEVIEEERAVSITQVIEELNERGEDVIFLGDGVPVYQNIIEENIKVAHFYAPSHVNRQRASSVGMLALSYIREGRKVLEPAKAHKPVYLRKSQAERERIDREKQKEAAKNA
ncbi:MAG: tRNA (adenosine(37)-N6)-threonylcarbamoyltransferase complex dimerization subunit type 1 TsaB [Lachnospiraceae bacterium]